MKKILEGLTALILAVLSCIVFINVILRYGFESSILSTDELSRYLFVWLTFLGAIVAFMENVHVKVSLLTDKLSPNWQRLVAIIAHSLMLFVTLLLAVGSWQKTVQDWSDHSPILGIPMGALYAACLPTSIAVSIILLNRLWLLLKQPTPNFDLKARKG